MKFCLLQAPLRPVSDDEATVIAAELIAHGACALCQHQLKSVDLRAAAEAYFGSIPTVQERRNVITYTCERLLAWQWGYDEDLIEILIYGYLRERGTWLARSVANNKNAPTSV